MKPKFFIGVLTGLLCIGTGYVVGRFQSGMSHFVTYQYEYEGYEGQTVRAVFPRNHPTYGLPLVEYRTILQAFNDGHTDFLPRYICELLGGVISDAEHRKNAVKWDEIEGGDESISRAIQRARDALHSYTNQLPPPLRYNNPT
jgi:hypothetical protein